MDQEGEVVRSNILDYGTHNSMPLAILSVTKLKSQIYESHYLFDFLLPSPIVWMVRLSTVHQMHCINQNWIQQINLNIYIHLFFVAINASVYSEYS